MVNKSKHTDYKNGRLLYWMSIVVSIFFITVISGTVLIINFYRSGYFDFAIINFLIVDKFDAPGTCWTTNKKLLEGGPGYIDSKGRVAFKDEKGQERVLCIQNVTPQDADKYQLETDGLNNQ